MEARWINGEGQPVGEEEALARILNEEEPQDEDERRRARWPFAFSYQDSRQMFDSAYFNFSYPSSFNSPKERIAKYNDKWADSV